MNKCLCVQGDADKVFLSIFGGLICITMYVGQVGYKSDTGHMSGSTFYIE